MLTAAMVKRAAREADEAKGAAETAGVEVTALPSAERVRLGVRVNTGPAGETVISVWPEPQGARPSPKASVAACHWRSANNEAPRS